MIKRIVKMSFQEDKVEIFKSIFAENNKAIRSFTGCSHVELLQDENDPTIFFTYSLWKDHESIERYRNSELFAGVWAKTKILFKEKAQAWSVKELTY